MGDLRSTLPILAVVLTAGCAELPDHLLGDGSRGITALYPDDGAAGIPVHQAPFLDLGWDEPEDATVLARLVPDGGDAIELDCTPSGDVSRVRCDPPGALQPDTYYTLQAELLDGGTGPTSTRFTTAAPRGASFDVGHAMTVDRLGGEGTPSELIDLLFDGEPTLLVCRGVFDAGSVPADARAWVWGPGVTLPPDAAGTHAVDEGVGYPFAADVAVDIDGIVRGASNHAFLQVEIQNIWHQVRVDDVVVAGTLSTDDDTLPVCQLTLSAELPRVSIERIAERAGEPAATLLRTQVVYDVDTDGDGTGDAATVLLSTTGDRIEIQHP